MTSHLARTLILASMTLTIGVALSGNAYAGQDRSGVSSPPSRTLEVFDHLAHAERIGARDAYTDGARIGPRNAFADGA